ncbi:hypothetical protein SLS62_000495 [Diatrype stigma]|uniref:Inosine/uridine-preferring nucleoside hydrolase domain-containing protein n=1 Tax=Diatrype stigma TaxID=117547 RepID=A0AAN9V3K6_9PEZI
MHWIQSILVFCSLFRPNSAKRAPYNRTKPIIIDTDIFSDVDDVGALAVANVLHNRGLVDLRGVVIDTNSKYGALAASSINTYFGNGDVPIGALRPLTNETYFDDYTFLHAEYAARVSHNWPRSLNDSASTPTPVALYRSLLASTEEGRGGVTLISIGFLTNLAALLASPPDAISPLAGPALVAAKVAELVVMGGRYPSGWEFNFGGGGDPSVTAQVVNGWPRAVPVTFSGGELGGDVFSGAALAATAPPGSPVLAAYQWYVGRCRTARESWDPITTLYGILGLEGASALLGVPNLFAYANEFGYNRVAEDGSNAWVNDTRVSNQHWLKLAPGVTNATVAAVLDGFYANDPSRNGV